MNRGIACRVGQASSLSAPNRQDACPTLRGSWKVPTVFQPRIATMNPIVLVLVLVLETKRRRIEDEDENDEEDEEDEGAGA